MVAMSEDCGEEGGSDADQRVCHSLPEDVWVEILARTPASSLRLTSCVCKRWRHLAQSPTFLALHTERHEHQKSWLYVNSTRYRTTQDSSPPSELEESFTTHPVPFALPEEHISCGPGAIFYKFSETPSTHQKLLYRIGSLAKEWREAPELKYPRTTPVVGVVKVPGLNGAHKVVCMGGNLSLKVEVFSSESKVWEEGEDMPIEFQGKATFKSIAAAVCKQKMYVYHMYSGFVASYDVERRSWSSVKCLRPPGTQYCYLSVHNGELLLIGVSYEDEAFVFRGWRLDGSSMESRGKSTNVTFDLLGHSFHLHDHLYHQLRTIFFSVHHLRHNQLGFVHAPKAAESSASCHHFQFRMAWEKDTMKDNKPSCLRPFALQTAGVAAVVDNIEDGHHVGDANCFVTNTRLSLPPLLLSNSIQPTFVNYIEDGHLDGGNCFITNTTLSLTPLPRSKQFSPKGLGFDAPPTSEENISDPLNQQFFPSSEVVLSWSPRSTPSLNHSLPHHLKS